MPIYASLYLFISIISVVASLQYVSSMGYGFSFYDYSVYTAVIRYLYIYSTSYNTFDSLFGTG